MTSEWILVKIARMREHRFFRDEEFEFAMRLALGSAYHHAAEVGECLATAERIRERDFEGWFREWSRTAERMEGVARDCEARGHRVSAREAYLRASTYFFTASVFVDATDRPQQLVPTWERHRACWDRAAALFDPPFEPVAIPYEGTTLPGCWRSPDSTGRPRPLLLMNNGSDGPISDMYVFGGAGALARGYNVLAYDGPGQGAALHRQGLSLRPDWERVVTPVVDYALSRADVDPERIAIYGASMGGYMVARAAAFEKRIAAVITDPGVWDVATPSDSPVSRFLRRSAQHWWRAPIDTVAAALAARGPRPLRHTLRFGMRPYGTGSLVEMLTLLREYNLDGIAERISCPLLVLDPEGEQFWPGEARRLSDAAGGPTAIAQFSADEGGALHMQPLARGLSDQRILDWLDETLAGAGQTTARHGVSVGTPPLLELQES
jgi:dienelactone hydrolase